MHDETGARGGGGGVRGVRERGKEREGGSIPLRSPAATTWQLAGCSPAAAWCWDSDACLKCNWLALGWLVGATLQVAVGCV
jgi:hypothetical protein